MCSGVWSTLGSAGLQAALPGFARLLSLFGLSLDKDNYARLEVHCNDCNEILRQAAPEARRLLPLTPNGLQLFFVVWIFCAFVGDSICPDSHYVFHMWLAGMIDSVCVHRGGSSQSHSDDVEARRPRHNSEDDWRETRINVCPLPNVHVARFGQSI